jgi:hypothetical protein
MRRKGGLRFFRATQYRAHRRPLHRREGEVCVKSALGR